VGVMGYELVARALQQQGVDTFFFIMGAPMSSAEKAAIDRGIRGIDVRHEQAAAMMAHALAASGTVRASAWLARAPAL